LSTWIEHFQSTVSIVQKRIFETIKEGKWHARRPYLSFWAVETSTMRKNASILAIIAADVKRKEPKDKGNDVVGGVVESTEA
jgi:hypothetical protein